MSDDPRLDVQYCPQCGGTEFERRIPKRDDHERLCCTQCGWVHYVGPALAAAAILENEGRICLVRRAWEPGKGLWTFPGGFVDLEENPVEAARREVEEETGYVAEIGDLLGCYRSMGPKGKRVVVVVYSARLVGEKGTASEEVEKVAWFPRDEIPWDAFAFPAGADALRRYLDSS